MRILYCVKRFFFMNFEKFIVFAAVTLIIVSVLQGISTINVDAKSGSEAAKSSLVYAKSKSGKNRTKNNKVFAKKKACKNSETKRKKKLREKSKRVCNKKLRQKNKSNTYSKTSKTVKDRLNAAALKPKEFLKGKDEKIIKKHLNKIIDDDMSNYQKAKTCYDYLINNTYYAYGGWGNAIESVLEKGFGTCTEYSYVYMAMMRYLGFNAKTVDGSTAMAAGGYGYHMWTEVKLNGNTYVFDPQVEDDMSNGKINYYRFCKSYSEVSGSYIK